MNVGDLVRIRESGNAYRDLLYAGWLAVVTDIGPGPEPRYFCDSDEAVRRTGRMQAVSFRESFAVEDLEPADIAEFTGAKDAKE